MCSGVATNNESDIVMSMQCLDFIRYDYFSMHDCSLKDIVILLLSCYNVFPKLLTLISWVCLIS